MNKNHFPLELAPGIVKDFVKDFQEYTEAPDEFLAIIPFFVGSVIGGRWVEFNGQFLNDFYLIVGGTGTTKKSTAQALAVKLLEAIKRKCPHLQFEIDPGRDPEKGPICGPTEAYPIVTHFSAEGLQTHAIGDGTSTAINIGEYGTLFEIGKRQGQQNTISELTNMYDGNPISVRTVSRRITAQNYSISILAASTESWLSDFCSAKNISGGFVNRHLVVTGSPERILPKPKLPSEEIWLDFINRFTDLIPLQLHPTEQNLTVCWQAPVQKLAWSNEADAFWDVHYRHRTELLRKVKLPFLAEVSAREPTHAIKIAGLSAFLDRRRVVNLKDLEFGIKVARWSVRNVLSMAADDSPQHSQLAERILSKIRKMVAVTKTDLARALGGKQVDVNRQLAHLLIDNEIVDCPDGYIRVANSEPNSQQSEIDEYLNKTDVYRIFENIRLGVGTEQAPH